MKRSAAARETRRLQPPWIGPRLILAQLRSEWAVVATLIGVVFLTSLVGSAAPRLFSQMSEDALEHEIRQGSPSRSGIGVERDSRILSSPGPDFFAAVEGNGSQFLEQEIPESVRAIVASHSYVVDSPSFRVHPLPGEPGWSFTSTVRFRYQQEVERHVELIAGRMPEPQAPVSIEVGPDGESLIVPVYEIVLTPETLAALQLELGDRVVLFPDGSDELFRNVPTSLLDYQLVLQISGVIEPTVPAEDFWNGDFQLHRPSLFVNPDIELKFAMGLGAPADYGRLLRDTGWALWKYAWHYQVDADRLDVARVPRLSRDLRSLAATYPSRELARPGETSVSGGLLGLIDRFIEQRGSTIDVLSTVTIGLLAVSFSVMALLAALIQHRQRDTMILLRTRGVSSRQLAVSNLAQALLVAVPATIFGYRAARWIVPGAANGIALQVAILVAIVATALIVTAARPVINRQLGALARSDAIAPSTVSARRLVLEGAVVVAAAGSVVLLRRRGLVADIDSADAAFDPLLAAAPSLAALAAGLVLLRLYTLPVRLGAWLASKRTGLVGFVGLRRMQLQASSARTALLVIGLAAAIAVFAGSMRLSIEDGQQVAAWQEVGADYSVTTPFGSSPLTTSLDLSSVTTIEASASGHHTTAVVRLSTGDVSSVDFLALEMAEYRSVAAEAPNDQPLAAFLFEERTTTSGGSEPPPVPAIVSRSWSEARSMSVGTPFSVVLGSRSVPVYISEVRDHFPTIPAARPFVIADLESIEAANDGIRLPPTVLFFRAPATSQDEIVATVHGQVPSYRVASRRALFDEIHTAPFVAGVSDGYRLVLLWTVLLAIAAALASFALTSKTRIRDLAFLRTQGLSRRQAGLLTAVEQLPASVLAALFGGLVGLAIAKVLGPSTDLSAFVGADIPIAAELSLFAVGVITAGLTVALLLAIAAASFFVRDAAVRGIIRSGER